MVSAADILDGAGPRPDQRRSRSAPLEELGGLLGLADRRDGWRNTPAPASEVETEARVFELLDNLTEGEFDALLEGICTRDLGATLYPFLHLDVTPTPSGGTRMFATATGVSPEGDFEPVGLLAGEVDDPWFWGRFLGQLVERGLHGVAVVGSPDLPALRQVLERVLPHARWQRSEPLERVTLEDALAIVGGSTTREPAP